MSKHTPGPWEVSTFAAHTDKAGLPAGVYTVEEDGTDGDYVCTIETDWIEPDEAHANARLIAAAPELLDACTALASLYDAKAKAKIAEYEGSGTEALADPDFVDAVFAKQVYETVTPAITKATGGTDAQVPTD